MYLREHFGRTDKIALITCLTNFTVSGTILKEHSMDQYRSRLKLSENFERHWSILISGEIHMDQSLVHTFSGGNTYGPMVLKVLPKFPPTLVLVHGWLFPEIKLSIRNAIINRELQPSPPSTEPKIRETGKSHFQFPNIPFSRPSWDPFKWPFSGI